MAVKPPKRPLRVFRKNSADAAMLAGATADSYVAPSYGWGVVNILMTLTQEGTLVVYQRQRASSTWTVAMTYALPAAGNVSDVIPVTGEMVRALFTNGGVAQSPEILISLS